MKLDNRNKKIAQEPEVQAIVNDDAPVIVEAEESPKDDIIDDIIETPETIAEKEVQPEPVEEPVKTAPIIVEEPDYKEKFINSSKEAIVLYSKNKKLTDTIEEASHLPEPTEEDLRVYARSQGADYDELEEFSKGILRETYINKKRFEKISEAAQDSKRLDEWVDKVDSFVGSSENLIKYPAIADYADEFRAYCLDRGKPQRRGLDLEELVAAFLFHAERIQPKKNKGSLLLSGGNGKAMPEKPKGITEEDVMILRKSGERGQKEYRRLIKEGKVKFDI